MRIDFLLRKGNESLLENHPYIYRLWVWDKQKNKYFNMARLIYQLRHQKYDHVINVHRFATSGLLAVLSGAKEISGFVKNPFSVFFTHCFAHPFGDGTHEIERNQQLISYLTDSVPALPRLYPQEKHYQQAAAFQQSPYVCIAPASVWFTKQFPVSKWIELIDKIPDYFHILLIGGKQDWDLCENICRNVKRKNIENVAGKLNLLASAALMQGAVMNYVNDSAPMHLASAVNAPVCAVFCSTVPEFGYGPLSDKKFVIQTTEELPCRPCGVHGRRSCPQKHFRCANSIQVEKIIAQTLTEG
ncbi:MAG: glycosyltransferase family 9 protein [Cytophagales bacterium]|nr:glycosyltransferase family 9 protein [Bernardetiaceae bacterium]MDW8210562.1 glycosyltransferase family 9 protein [Cytophagales bacterium]